MDEGEHDKADPFDSDYDVAVALYAGHGSFVALEGASDDSNLLVFFEVGFGEDLAACGVGGCEEAQEPY